MAKKYNQFWGRRVRPSRRVRLPEMDERYEKGHVESVAEFINRGGIVTRVPASVSQDRLDWPSLIASALGESADDIARGFAWDDLNRTVRDAIAGQNRGSLSFDIQEEN